MDVCPDALRDLECDRRDLKFERIDFCFALLQLQQMLATRQSHQMPVKNQQQPAPGAIGQPACFASDTRQLEIRGRASDQRIRHCLLHPFADAELRSSTEPTSEPT